MSSSQLAIVQTYKVQTTGNSTASKAKKPSHGSHSNPYIVITLPRIFAISSHTYVSRTIRLEPALTYLSSVKVHTMLTTFILYDHQAFCVVSTVPAESK